MREPKHKRKSSKSKVKRKSTKCSHQAFTVLTDGRVVCKCGLPWPVNRKAGAVDKRKIRIKAHTQKKRPPRDKSNQGGSIRNG